MTIMHKSSKQQILSKIYGHGMGWAFSATDFLPDFKRYEIDESLSSLAKAGKIRRCMRGIYDYPMFSSILNKIVAPDVDNVAQALARKFRWHILPHGDTALNCLGLSTQVPGTYLYLSSGPNREYDLAGRMLQFQSTKQREAIFKYPESALAIQALRALGEKRITPEILTRLQRCFTSSQWQKIQKDTTAVTGWIYEYIRQLAIPEDPHG
jgi:hypothetical protein